MSSGKHWRRTFASTVAGLALVASACGGGGGTSTTAKSTTTTAQDISADTAAAAAAVLQLADLPTGWEGTPHTEDDSGPDINGELADCVGVSRTLLTTTDNPTNADSPDFSEAESGATAQNSIGFVSTVAKARQALAVFARTELPDCLATVMEKTLADQLANPDPGEPPATGLTFGTISVKRMSFPNVADETSALRVTIPISVETTTIEQYMDFVVMRVGRAGVTLTLAQAMTPFDSALAERLARAVVARLRGAATPSAPTTTTTTAANVGGVRAMKATTAGEKAALALAATDLGRKWAHGDPNKAAMAEGKPFLGGYSVALDDGKNQYSVRVLNGKVVPPFGPTGDIAIVSPTVGTPTIQPESDQQRAAVDAAKAALADRFPAATRGGIELYLLYFPVVDALGTYYYVATFASASVGTFAQGGTDVRP
jgi:hypothetical protein